MNTRAFGLALLAGLLLRLAALPLPGTHDVGVWKIWSYAAAAEGVGRLYGIGGTPPERRIVSFRGSETTVDYPPLAMAELGVTGRIYRAVNRGRYPDSTALIVAIKLAIASADAALFAVIWWSVRRLSGPGPARWAALAYWLNPAVLMNGVVLGYLDPLFGLPIVGALAAAALGWPALAGICGAAAVLTKPQAVVLAPAIVLAVWQLGDPRRRPARLAVAALASIATVAAVTAPVVLAGGLANMLLAFSRLGQHDMLSGNACNLWWIVGYVMRAAYSIGDMGVWAAFTTPTKILQISRVIELGYPNPRAVGLVLAAMTMAWGIWTTRQSRDVWLCAALAAFLVHAYATLSAQVHENHLYAAIPFLIVAAAGRPRFRPLAWTLTAIFAVNLNLFYGFSEDIGYAIPRTLTVIDTTVLVSLANCAALVWHARLLRSEAVSYRTLHGRRIPPIARPSVEPSTGSP